MHRGLLKFGPFLGLILLAGYGCYWDNQETLYPAIGACDTTSVSYSSDIVPILSTYCYSCHSNLNAPQFGSGIALEDYQDVTIHAPAALGAMKHEQGFPPMPQGGAKLSACLISTFEAWVKEGSPEN